MAPADRRRRRRRRRAQHLLHPGERRQQALRQPRPPEGAEGRADPSCRSSVGGCLAQKDRDAHPRAGAARRRRVRHPQRAPRRRAARTQARADGPDHRDPRGRRRSTTHEAFPSALPARREVDHAAWVTIQIGCDNRARSASCPSVRGREISRPFGDIVARGRARSPPTASPRSRCSARTSTPTAATYAAARQPAARGACGRCSPTCCARVGAVDGIRRVRFTQPAPEGPAARDDRGDGRDAGGVRAPAPAAAVGQRPRAGRACTAATPPSATSSGSPRPARRSPTSPSPPTSSSASPARPTTTSSARSRSSPRPSTTAPTRSSSRPGPAPRRPSMTDALRRTRGRAPSASSGCGSWSSAARWPSTRRGSAASRRSLVEGPCKKDPTVLDRPHPPEQARALRAADRRSRAGTLRRRRDHRRRAAPPRGRARRACSSRPRAPHPHPGGRRAERRVARRRSRSSARPRRASRRSRWPSRDALGDVEIVVARLDAGVPGHGHRHRQADARRAGRGAPPPASTSPIPARTSRSPRSSAASPTALADIEARGHRALLVGGTGLYLRAVVDDLDLPGRVARRRAPSSRPSRDAAALHARLDALDPRRRRRASSRRNRRRIVRALEVTIGSGRPFSSFGPGLDDLPADRRSLRSALRWPRPRRWPSASRSASHAHARRRASSTRSRRWPRRRRGLSRTAAPGARLQGAARPPRRRATSLDEARRRWPIAPHPPVRPCASERWFRRDPRITLGRRRPIGRLRRARRCRPCLGDSMHRMHLTKHHGLGNDFLVLLAPTTASRRRRRPLRRRAVRPPPGHRRRRAASRSTPARDGADLHDGAATTPTAAAAEMSGNGIRCLAQAVAAAPGSTDGRRSRSPPTPAVRTRRRRARPTTGDAIAAERRHGRGRASIDDADGWHGSTSTAAAASRTVDVGNPHLVVARRRRSTRVDLARPLGRATRSRRRQRRVRRARPRADEHHDAGVGARRRHDRGVRHRRVRGRRGRARVGPGRRRAVTRAHARRRRSTSTLGDDRSRSAVRSCTSFDVDVERRRADRDDATHRGARRRRSLDRGRPRRAASCSSASRSPARDADDDRGRPRRAGAARRHRRRRRGRPASCSGATAPTRATYIGKGKAEELRELSPRGRRRHRRVRRRAHARRSSATSRSCSGAPPSTAPR